MCARVYVCMYCMYVGKPCFLYGVVSESTATFCFCSLVSIHVCIHMYVCNVHV